MSIKRVPIQDEFNWQLNVKSRITAAALAGLSPAKGDRYILTDGANINKIATYNSSTWDYLVATEGFICWVDDENLFYKFDGTDWSIEIGATGTTGAAGTTGITGTTGAEGADGTTGITGTTGAIGTTGAVGTTGAEGADGTTGAQGTTGITGTTGAVGTTGANANVEIILKVLNDDENLATGDGKMYITIPSVFNGMNLVAIAAHVYTVSSSGLPSIALYNLTDSVDMLSVNVTIDENEKDSKDATTAPTIDTTHDDVATGDELRVDVDVSGTGTKGLELRLKFQAP